MRKLYLKLLLLSLVMTIVSSLLVNTNKISAAASETNKTPGNLVNRQMFQKSNIFETRTNQPFYEISDVNNFKFTLPETNAVKQNKLDLNGEISEQIAYEQLFRIITSFEKKAEKLENEGNRHRAEFLKNFLQIKANLSRQQSDALKIYAKSFTTEIEQIKKRYKTAQQTQTESPFPSENFEQERTRLFLEYRNHLKGFLGENGFENFAKFVQEKITSRLNYRQDEKSNRVLVSTSMVEYNELSDEVMGYSFTDEPGGRDSIWNLVYATLTSDSQGVVDYDDDEKCDERAEVFLFASGSDPEETFCIDGIHEFALERIQFIVGKPENPLPKTTHLDGWGGCYGYKVAEELPPSDDCVTTPPLPNVTEVSFQTIAPNTPNSMPIDNNPNAGGGLRIFPDNDMPMENQNRQRIRVVANISEQQSNIRVYFQSFDLDDPSTDDTIVDRDGSGPDDNNGMPRNGQLHTTSATTNSSGVATVEFSVTMQPGDNFAIAAATDPDELSGISANGINLTGSNGTIQTDCDETDAVCRSEMLTVWRRLHIEVDSMGESQGNFVLGTTAGSYELRRFQSADIALNPSPNNPLEPNRFEGGRLVLGGISLPVNCDISMGINCNTATTVRVRNTTQNTVYIPTNAQFQLYDDDDFNNNDGNNPDGDTGEDISTLQGTYLEDSDDPTLNRFAPAYIRPRYDIGDSNDATPFWMNVATDDVPGRRALFDFDQVNTEASEEFWTIYLLSGYQYVTIEDEDPETEGPTVGVVDRLPDLQGVRRGQGAIAFLETSGIKECSADHSVIFCDIYATKIHEIGHLFGTEHGDGGVMDDLTTDFSPTSIRAIRGRNYP